MTAQQKIAANIASRSTDSLKEMAVALYSDVREESSIVLSAVLDVLMLRVPEAEFVGFCSKLEGE